jgi:hypothetical protein
MKKVGIAYTTKDRVDFTKQTLPPIVAESDDFDIFWIDGSATEEGKRYHATSHPSTNIVERHAGINQGPAHAIQYAWQTLYNKGYQYIGLIENDVKLKPSWFKKTMALFDAREKVGAVSSRCFTDRISKIHEGYATMANVGAGMIIVKRELIPALMLNWKMPMLWEVQALFKHYTGSDYPIPKMVLEKDPELKQDWQFTHDWWFEIVLLSKGYRTLALTPSMAYNLDDPDGFRDPVCK